MLFRKRKFYPGLKQFRAIWIFFIPTSITVTTCLFSKRAASPWETHFRHPKSKQNWWQRKPGCQVTAASSCWQEGKAAWLRPSASSPHFQRHHGEVQQQTRPKSCRSCEGTHRREAPAQALRGSFLLGWIWSGSRLLIRETPKENARCGSVLRVGGILQTNEKYATFPMRMNVNTSWWWWWLFSR